jgi:hypothetical protein
VEDENDDGIENARKLPPLLRLKYALSASLLNFQLRAGVMVSHLNFA